jgi:amino acid permease
MVVGGIVMKLDRFRAISMLTIGIFLAIVGWCMIHMDAMYYVLGIVIYAMIILCIGFYIGYVIYRSHEDAKKVTMAYGSIAEDLTRIAELVEEHNRLLARIIEYRKESMKRRYEDGR